MPTMQPPTSAQKVSLDWRLSTSSGCCSHSCPNRSIIQRLHTLLLACFVALSASTTSNGTQRLAAPNGPNIVKAVTKSSEHPAKILLRDPAGRSNERQLKAHSAHASQKAQPLNSSLHVDEVVSLLTSSEKHVRSRDWPAYVRASQANEDAPTAEMLGRLEESLAVAYIAIGDAAAEPHLVLSVSTLRRAGGFRGDVFVITDSPHCVPALATAVVVPSTPADRPQYIYGKHFKQLLLELLPLSPKHDFVWYLDMDIFIYTPIATFFFIATREAIVKNASISLFLEGVGINGLKAYSKNHQAIRVVNGTLSYRKPHFHGGMFLVRRGVSEACLARWASWYSTSEKLDQPHLSQAVAVKACAVSVLPAKYYGQPHPDNKGVYYTFNHYTRTGRLVGHSGVDDEMLTESGRTLFGLAGDVAKSWWRLPSPLCGSRSS